MLILTHKHTFSIKQLLLTTTLLTGLAGPMQAQDTRREIGNLVIENVPTLPADLMERVDQYQNVRGASMADWDRDGKGLFIATRFADVPQIYYVFEQIDQRHYQTNTGESGKKRPACTTTGI